MLAAEFFGCHFVEYEAVFVATEGYAEAIFADCNGGVWHDGGADDGAGILFGDLAPTERFDGGVTRASGGEFPARREAVDFGHEVVDSFLKDVGKACAGGNTGGGEKVIMLFAGFFDECGAVEEGSADKG